MRVAAAPISWGVCEVPGWGRVLDPGTVLGEMAELGITATELGPPGYLPSAPDELIELLGSYGLGLVGGFLAVPLHTGADETIEEADRVAALLKAGGGDVLVLAAATGLDGYDERPELTDGQWRTLIDTAERIAEGARAHGLRTVLHPHVGTHVERAAEIERFLADSSLPLCLDTGHMMIGGADPVAITAEWASRIGHVHLKDVRQDLAARVQSGELGYTEAVHKGVYVPLGDGDVDIATIVGALTAVGYDGWYVLEQDTALADDSPSDKPRTDVARSITHLVDTAAKIETSAR
ncbi:TIM barrel protein [Labedaea rhizosphaerae]|uniref:2-keto-myo-inositol dehydratase n=1 Tax=Labedaea rhizosphaerae TaxID=598644 RepID=A0A4R6SIU4_LABRH|nr:TIM barrel protein [Labedaea rhizosphaerae]TDQ01567.1 2-keto-myo-inositol dehydratase [Labedaea rhizosphaerae]